MRPTSWLRTAAVLTALFAVGHTSGRPWTPALGPAEQPIIDGMHTVRFSLMSTSLSYWDIYQGFGLTLSVLLAMQAMLLWQCATLARNELAKIRPLLLTLLVGAILTALVAIKCLFILPVVSGLAIALCIALALWPRPEPH